VGRLRGEAVTPTSKKVSRVTVNAHTGRLIGTKPRRIAVTISGETLIMRLYGTQQREYMNIKDVFETARWARIKSELMQKVNHKRRSK
jgi:hypothetical protein